MIITRRWTVPQRDDDSLVPPVKTLRKRLSGVYRADGFSGPTRRYVLIVAMLVGLASLPTLAAITAGSNELDEGSTGALDSPFLPPASSGPVQPYTPPTSAPPVDEGFGPGQAHRQRSKPNPPRYARSTPPPRTDPAHRSRREVTPARTAAIRREVAPAQRAAIRREVVPVRTAAIRRETAPTRKTEFRRAKICRSYGERPTMRRFVPSVVRDRPDDRPETIRRATVADRPKNLRPTRTAERTHNSRRLQAESRPEEARSANRSYRGSHRAERHHRADGSRANRRNFGRGWHHPEHARRR